MHLFNEMGVIKKMHLYMLIFAHRQKLSPARSDFGKKLKIYPGQNSGGIVKICYDKVFFFQPHSLKNGRSQKSYCNQKPPKEYVHITFLTP